GPAPKRPSAGFRRSGTSMAGVVMVLLISGDSLCYPLWMANGIKHHNKPTCELTFMLICTNRVPIAKACGSILVVNAHRTYDECVLIVTGGICRNADKGTWAVTDLIDTTEMYLRTIYELMEEGIAPLRARIAERLEHSGPTVSQTVARMERDG